MQIGLQIGISHLSAPLSVDEDVADYFIRAGVTDSEAKTRVNGFVKGLKSLGLWNNLVYVPCHSDMGGLHQLGGAVQRTNTPWTLSGDYALSSDGITGTGYTPATNQVANRLNPQQALTTAGVAATPTYVGLIVSQDYSDTASQSVSYIRSGSSVYNYSNFGTFTSTGSYGTTIAGINSYNCYRVTYSQPPIYRERNRPWMGAVWLRGNSNQARNMLNSLYDSGVTTNTYDHAVYSAKFAISNGAPLGSPGKIHGVFYAYCDPDVIGGRASWQRLWALINSTLFSHKRTGGFLRVQIGGQSNASASLAAYLNRDNLCANDTRCSEVWQNNQGGQPITWWVGAGTPARTAGYGTTIYDGSGTSTLEQGRPLNGIGLWRETYVWIQGESDSETRDLVNNYAARLTALMGFIRADAANPSMRFIIGKIGYHYNYRSDTTIGNFTASAATGGAAVLNGDWAISAMATATENYVWTKSGYQLLRQNSRWEFVRNADSVVMLASTTDAEHPALVQWGGAITIGDSRTGRIEEIRKIQQEVADADPLADAINMKDFEYNNADRAHMTTAGYQAFAAAISAIASA